MGKPFLMARPIRKPAPNPNQNKGRPHHTTNAELGKMETYKFIMTLDMETVNEIAKMLAPGQSMQSYIRYSIIKEWRDSR
jgi:hypothetical protein